MQDIFRSKAHLMAKSSMKGDMADGFVKDCLFVYEKLLVDTTCNKALDKLESKYGLESPLNSLQKLRALSESAQLLVFLLCDHLLRQWILKVICDMVEGGALASLVELLKLKRTAAHHFWQAREKWPESESSINKHLLNTALFSLGK